MKTMKYLTCFLLLTLTTAGTTIESLPSKCYVKTHPIITEIDCPGSNITSLPPRLPRLVSRVCLQQNRIQTIPDLSGFARVVKLNLSQNLLTSIPWTSFRHMTDIVTLDLSHNQISTVRLDLAINVLRHLHYVSLAYNKLVTFSQANLGVSFRGIELSGHRHIQGNPILCDCRMVWLAGMAHAFHQCWPFSCTAAVKNSMLFHSIVYSDVLQCNSPNSLKGVPLRLVNLNTCPAAKETTTKSYLKITPVNSNMTWEITVSSVDEDWNRTTTANRTGQPAKTDFESTAAITTTLICITYLGIWLACRWWFLLSQERISRV